MINQKISSIGCSFLGLWVVASTIGVLIGVIMGEFTFRAIQFLKVMSNNITPERLWSFILISILVFVGGLVLGGLFTVNSLGWKIGAFMMLAPVILFIASLSFAIIGGYASLTVGIVIGALIGLMQWLVLRRYIELDNWVWASTGGWIVGGLANEAIVWSESVDGLPSF